MQGSASLIFQPHPPQRRVLLPAFTITVWDLLQESSDQPTDGTQPRETHSCFLFLFYSWKIFFFFFSVFLMPCKFLSSIHDWRKRMVISLQISACLLDKVGVFFFFFNIKHRKSQLWKLSFFFFCIFCLLPIEHGDLQNWNFQLIAVKEVTRKKFTRRVVLRREIFS